MKRLILAIPFALALSSTAFASAEPIEGDALAARDAARNAYTLLEQAEISADYCEVDLRSGRATEGNCSSFISTYRSAQIAMSIAASNKVASAKELSLTETWTFATMKIKYDALITNITESAPELLK